MRVCIQFILASILIISFTSVSGQGTTCGAAVAITVGTSCTTQAYFFNVGSTTAAPSCSGLNDDGFYSFTATTNFTKVTATTNKNLTIAIYSGTCGALVEVGCVNAVPSNQTEELTVATTPGTAYILRLVRNNGGGGGTIGNVCVVGFDAPANVGSGLTLWFDANTTTGVNISSWADLSGNGRTATQGTAANQPRRLVESINFNQAVDFDGSDAIGNTGGAYSTTTYLVAKSTTVVNSTATGQHIWGYDCGTCVTDGGGLLTGGGTSALTNELLFHAVGHSLNWRAGQASTTDSYAANVPYIFVARENAGATASEMFANAISVNNTTSGTYIEATDEAFNIGAPGPATGMVLTFTGQVGELINYNNRPTDAEHRKLQSYLAIKFGITLGSTASTYDYHASDATVIWPGDATYQHDVAGIGRDDEATQDQPKSKSENPGSIVTIEAEAALDDMDYLVWGNDAESFQNNGSLDIDGITIEGRVDRVWHTEVTNTPGTVTVTMDVSSIPGTITGSDLRLMVDADGVFAAGATYYTGTYDSGAGTFTVTGVTLSDEDFFTLGTINFTQTPLPVELVSFEANPQENGTVKLNWETASEYNSDHFAVLRSYDGQNYSPIGTVKSAGNSSSSIKYEFIDYEPKRGVSYYRLAQVDLDGTIAYSSIKAVEMDFEFTVYPNPANEMFVVEMEQNEFDFQQTVQLYNAVGERVRIQASRSDNRYTVDTSSLPEGVYFLQVETLNSNVREKILVVH